MNTTPLKLLRTAVDPVPGSRYELLGMPIDALTMSETVEACAAIVESRRFAQHSSLNAGKYVLACDDPDVRESLVAADIIGADGMSVVWAGRLLGVPLPERVPGIDLMERLLGIAEDRGWPVYFLGAEPQTLECFVDAVLGRYPALIVAGRHDGFYEDEVQVAGLVADSGARILFVGMSSPKKERFVDARREELGDCLVVGVGGSFDVWAGKITRAPLWMQRAGLEWFYRFMQEPGRMWKRYLVGNSRFAMLVIRELLARNRH